MVKSRGINMRAKGLTCSVDGCAKPVVAKLLCEAHWQRSRIHGDPLGGGTTKGALLKWLRDHVSFEGEECLIWPFGNSGNGYGRVRFEGRNTRAHRVMCEIRHGPPKDDNLEAAHSCGNGHAGCVNPRHLRWATRGENQSDKYLHRRLGIGRNALITEKGMKL